MFHFFGRRRFPAFKRAPGAHLSKIAIATCADHKVVMAGGGQRADGIGIALPVVFAYAGGGLLGPITRVHQAGNDQLLYGV